MTTQSAPDSEDSRAARPVAHPAATRARRAWSRSRSTANRLAWRKALLFSKRRAASGIDTPTLCFLENLTPVNVCRICVVEVEGSRALVPACSRPVEPGMVIRTDSERVRLSRRLVLELLASSVDVSTAPQFQGYMRRYGARPERFGEATPAAAPGERDAAQPGHHHPLETGAATVPSR